MGTKWGFYVIVLSLSAMCYVVNSSVTSGQEIIQPQITNIKADYQDVKKITYVVVFEGDDTLRHVAECWRDTTDDRADSSIPLEAGQIEAQFSDKQWDITYYLRLGAIPLGQTQPSIWSNFAEARAMLSLKPIPVSVGGVMGTPGWIISSIIGGIFVISLVLLAKKGHRQLRMKEVFSSDYWLESSLIERIVKHWLKFKDSTHLSDEMDPGVLDVDELQQKDFDEKTLEINGRHTGREHLENAMVFCRKEDTPTTSILLAGLKNHWNNYGKDIASQEIDRDFEKTILREKAALQGRTLDWLWVFAGISPLLGLLGTVIGLFTTFRKLPQVSGMPTNVILKSITSGIGTAIITTIVGLIAGILIYGMYQLVKSRIDEIFDKWEKLYIDITSQI